MTVSQFTGIWGASAALTLALIMPPCAVADVCQLHGSVCRPSLATWDYGASSTGGMRSLESVVDATFVCPVFSDSATGSGDDEGDNFDHKRAYLVYIDVDDQNNDAIGGSVSAQLCITLAGSAGGSCGSADTTGTTSTGEDTLEPARTVWNTTASASDYPTISIQLPDTDIGESAILGITAYSL